MPKLNDCYIRTRSGIYKVSRKLNAIPYYLVKGKWHIKCDNVLKESNDVRCLCDIFVEEFPIYKGNKIVGIDHQFWQYEPNTGKFSNDICEEIDDIKNFYDRKFGFYGAIWDTDGLHYKIKLNKNGVFRLIE